MNYTVKIEEGKKVIRGNYIPSGHTCKCKECDFKIEVPKCTSDTKIAELVSVLKSML